MSQITLQDVPRLSLNITVEDIADAIFKGSLDGQLQEIQNTIKLRQNYLANRTLVSIQVGDRARITMAEIRPKYLVNQEVIIRSKRKDKLICDLVVPQGRFSRGIILEAKHITKI